MNNKKECAITNINYNFYNFAKKYIIIKDSTGVRSFNKIELNKIKEMQIMMNRGYKLQLIRLREGNKIMWVKLLNKYHEMVM